MRRLAALATFSSTGSRSFIDDSFRS